MCLFMLSCGSKPWPEDAISQLKQTGALSAETKMVSLLTNTPEDLYLESVLETYKQNYPNYADFESAAKENPQHIKELRIPCIKKYSGNDINSIWNIIESNDGVINLRNQLPEEYFKKYKELMLSKMRTEFQNMGNLISKMTSDENYIPTFIDKSDKECGVIIMNEIQIDQEKKLQEEQKTVELNNLFDESLDVFHTGSISLWNKTSKTITLAIGYYYNGQKWKGWVSDGWWDLAPGQKATIKIPLNETGNINGIIYYCAKFKDSTSWNWGGDNSFIVSDENFRIPNADKYETLSCNRKFHFSQSFKKIEIGSTSDYSLNLTE